MPKQTRKIWCCGCNAEVSARLTFGREVYPRRRDLATKPVWKCDRCKNFVGCHHKTKNPTNPLGCIPTKEIKNARQHIHRLLDPIWKSGRMKRGDVYREIALRMKKASYHTADIRSVEEARKVYRIVQHIDAHAVGDDWSPLE
jgi:hypothetical protein